MDANDRLNLQKMINENNVEDFTEDIRKKKHSIKLKKDLNNLLSLKVKYSNLAKNDKNAFENICIEQCSFMFNNYTDIFNKIQKDELDIAIFERFLLILNNIESGVLDQHEASYQVGLILKQLYIDSALRKSNHLDKINNNNVNNNKLLTEHKNITWNQWKKINM